MDYIIFVIMVVYVLNCHCEWTLKWHDEFDGNNLDRNKWDVTDGKDILEAPVNEEIISHSRDSPKNIHLLDGVLAITPFQEENNGRAFTSATINSKITFLYGRVDIRVALPMGDLLKTAITLLPVKNEYGRERANGEIEIVADVQRANYYSRASYHGAFGAMRTYPSLDEFQKYSLEWNETLITWSMNGSIMRTFDLDRVIDNYYGDKKGRPFDHQFYITMRLQVFKFQTDEFEIGEKYHQKWKCPPLLIDYVRLYQQDNSTNSTQQLLIESSLKSSSKKKQDFCSSFNKKLSLLYNPYSFNLNIIWMIIVPVCSLIIMVSLVILIVIIVKRKRKQMKQEEEVYADYMDYDDPSKMRNYEYSDIVYARTENCYVTDQTQVTL